MGFPVTFVYLFIFVYQMGRLCGGAHEISGIKAPLFLHGWVVWTVLGVGGWVVVREGVVGWWCAGGGDGVGDGVFGGWCAREL